LLAVPLRFRPLAVAAVLAAALSAGLVQSSTAQAGPTTCDENREDAVKDADRPLSQIGSSRFRRMIRCLINEERARHDLDSTRAGVQAPPPLDFDTLLTTAAQRHTDDQVARRYLCHMATEPDLVDSAGRLICDAPKSPAPNGRTILDRLRNVGYCSPSCAAIGENLFQASPSITPHQVVDKWMGSAPHRANILNTRFREMGVGVRATHATTGVSGGTVTVKFGTQ
jgi:uncharacterized protein YkwD